VIRVTKSTQVPSSLNRGIPATEKNCALYDADPAAYRSGAKQFSIKSSIYGTNVVKRRLKADQNDKCAFCEAIFDANVAGDVEHYRPKGTIDDGAGRLRPGYYWLAYTWTNLAYACPDCNGYRKRGRFPLADETQRAMDHHSDIGKEKPLLLDPSGPDDPRRHIRFRGEAPIGQTPEGETTIEILALDRSTLARDRLRHLQNIKDLRNAVLLLESDTRLEAIDYVTRARAQLVAAIQPTAEFSAATADYLTALEAGTDFLPSPPNS